jgi:hypothetical protein
VIKAALQLDPLVMDLHDARPQPDDNQEFQEAPIWHLSVMRQHQQIAFRQGF